MRERNIGGINKFLMNYMIKIKKLFRSVKYAFKGIKETFKKEQNFRIQILVASMVGLLSFYFHIKIWEAIAVILSILMVLVLELINTTFEKMVDMLAPRIHPYAKDIKDIMAATVLIASVCALIIGILIFWPYIVK